MRIALLIADLEGIANVDRLDALAFGGEGHPEACARMTVEVNAAIEGLVSQGFEHVRVSDSHRSGSGAPNLSPGQLHDAAQLHFVDPDAYGGPLLAGVEAVACVGMHAAAGTRGFAAHTVQVHTAWLLGGQLLSETQLAFFLAADLGLRAVFAAGDDVLGRAVGSLSPYVTTKRSAAIDSAASNDCVPQLIRAAAATSPCTLQQAPAGPLTLRFKTRAQAAAAADAGAQRTSDFECTFTGSRFTDRYLAALRAIGATEHLLGEGLTAMPGTAEFAAFAAGLLLEPFPDLQPAR